MMQKKFTKLANFDAQEISMVSGVCQIKEDFNEINDDFRALGGGIDTSQVTIYIEKNLNLTRPEVDEPDQYTEEYNQMLRTLMSPK